MKHKHAELIKAWADGAKIQWRRGDEYKWKDLPWPPCWIEDEQYRIKPEPKPDVVLYGVASQHWDAVARGRVDYLGCENSRDDNNLRLTFDGETGKLKKAEVL